MTVMGIDEVGRGCWAGPLVAGAVILPENWKHPADANWRLADSKRLSARQRRLADEGIRSVALAIGLGWVTAREVDTVGLTAAVRLAMQRAVTACGMLADRIIIDGSIQYLTGYTQAEALIKADATIPSVSAASIVAKVARDDWMARASRRFPGYGFERHVGYGTAEHREALLKHGVCKLHRRSYRPIADIC